jgi:hypothetical protein
MPGLTRHKPHRTPLAAATLLMTVLLRRRRLVVLSRRLLVTQPPIPGRAHGYQHHALLAQLPASEDPRSRFGTQCVHYAGARPVEHPVLVSVLAGVIDPGSPKRGACCSSVRAALAGSATCVAHVCSPCQRQLQTMSPSKRADDSAAAGRESPAAAGSGKRVAGEATQRCCTSSNTELPKTGSTPRGAQTGSVSVPQGKPRWSLHAAAATAEYVPHTDAGAATEHAAPSCSTFFC